MINPGVGASNLMKIEVLKNTLNKLIKEYNALQQEIHNDIEYISTEQILFLMDQFKRNLNIIEANGELKIRLILNKYFNNINISEDEIETIRLFHSKRDDFIRYNKSETKTQYTSDEIMYLTNLYYDLNRRNK